MNSSARTHRARAAWVFGFLLVTAGLIPVMAFVLRALLPAAAAAVALPGVHVPWADAVEAWFLARKVTLVTSDLVTGLVIAIPGLALMALGAWLARRQETVLATQKRQRQDALRRARHYRESAAA
ncbi:MAG TPA: hypothetical protein VG873_11050 [Burkholderiales bacterium]|nr:hypothetical protein [Burkholderiales bacterium]